ncbi:piggyBac transposable element-derived protein 4 [Nephila pilipes]|uniref:PiggyBac transposable element-derived protein 4 n=1 Tax=Nephila pilipes TaxID=299642 RepID=A0A8X6UDZ3_NEPPI|nr:piggyBac transposable element-derived protein 4 [Nephila pilipes]
MKRFLSLLLFQEVAQKPMEKWFWSKRQILSTPFFEKIMSEMRYGLLTNFLHFENNDAFDKELHPNPKLRKISEFLDLAVKKFKSLCRLRPDIFVDESLIAYKGRLG